MLTQQVIERRLNPSHSWNYLIAATEEMNLPFGKYALVAPSLVRNRSGRRSSFRIQLSTPVRWLFDFQFGKLVLVIAAMYPPYNKNE